MGKYVNDKIYGLPREKYGRYLRYFTLVSLFTATTFDGAPSFKRKYAQM
jgi:hypothetical protein